MTTTPVEERLIDLSVLKCAAGTDVGMRRDENQDSFGIIKGDGFHGYFVADGMGGVHGGAVASRIAVSGLEELLAKTGATITPEALSGIVGVLNSRIFERGSSDPTLAGMGTTVVGVIFTPHGALMLNVGDSRLYRVRGNSIVQLSEDHTLVRELIRSGAITPDQAENHPVSHMLTRSLGPLADVQLDCRMLPEAPEPGDVYLLCSDGLYNFVPDNELLQVVRQNAINDANQILINRANQRGGADNITVLLVAYGEEVGRGRSAAFRQARDASAAIHGDAEPAPVSNDGASGVEGDEGTDSLEDGPSGEGMTQRDGDPLARSTVAGAEPTAPVPPPVEEPKPRQRVSARPSGVTPPARRSVPVVALVGLALLLGLVVGSLARRYVPPMQALWEPVALLSGNNDAGSDSGRAGVPRSPDTDEALTQAPSSDRGGSDQTRPAPPQNQLEVIQQQVEQSGGGDDSGSNGSDTQSNRERLLETRRMFVSDIKKLEDQLQVFEQPVSPELGKKVSALRAQADELSARQAEIQQSMDAASRKLSQWYFRQKRLESQDPLKLAVEVGASSDIVQQKRLALENATYEFIAKRDEFELYPSNDRLREEVERLKERRAQVLRELQVAIETTVKSVLNETDQQLQDLKFQRNMLDLQVQSVMQDLEFAKTIAENNPESRRLLKSKMEQKLKGLRASLNEVNAILKVNE